MTLERDTGTPDLRSVLDDQLLLITLNRPKAGNALNPAMLNALQREIIHAENNADVRCVVVTGAGNAFCAGGDIRNNDIAPESPDQIDERIEWMQVIQRDTVGRLYAMSKPTLAVINGPAAGAGMSLALACDLRLMSNTTFMLTAFATVGLPGDLGAAYFLTRLIGSGRARELMFLPERISVEQALDAGLVNWCCAPEELAERSREIARQLAAGPPTAYACMKDNLNRAVAVSLNDYLDIEAAHQVRCMMSDDHKEGVTAFFEGRRPRFGNSGSASRRAG